MYRAHTIQGGASTVGIRANEWAQERNWVRSKKKQGLSALFSSFRVIC